MQSRLGRSMKRREFITLLGGWAAAMPFTVHAQQPAFPVIGFLSSQSPEGYTEPLRAFRQGLKEAGVSEGDNVAIEFRWTENQPDALRAEATALVRRNVAVIAAMDSPTAAAVGESIAAAAKAATGTIPIVFNSGEDPVRLGLVASLAQPGGNLTGINFFAAELTAKRLGLLRELLPQMARIAVIVNPNHASITEGTLRDVEATARTMGLKIRVFNTGTSRELSVAFASIAADKLDALFVSSGPFFSGRRVQMALLAARYGIPAIYTGRQYTEAGGLISYGASVTNSWRQVGIYTGRVLKGALPRDLPVVQADKFDLIINAETARLLGITVPSSLLATADEVIE